MTSLSVKKKPLKKKRRTRPADSGGDVPKPPHISRS
jgi:hypothetical protein